MKPHVICLMGSPLDGRLDTARWSKPKDGAGQIESRVYEAQHRRLDADAWLCGRVTMQEIAKGTAHPPADPGSPPRPLHVARRDADHYAVGLDRSGAVHWNQPEANGDPVIMLLGRDIPDAHLAELIADDISYIVSDDDAVDLAAMLDVLHGEFGIETLAVEGGGGVIGTMLEAGLVDEFHLLLFPAIDGTSGGRSIIESQAGLGGRLTVSLLGYEALTDGVLLVRYAIDAVSR